MSIAAGAAQQFTAVGTDAHGNVVSIVPHWFVVAGGGAIDETGLFTADSTPGNYPGTVRASISQHCFVIAGSSTVTVTGDVVPN